MSIKIVSYRRMIKITKLHSRQGLEHGGYILGKKISLDPKRCVLGVTLNCNPGWGSDSIAQWSHQFVTITPRLTLIRRDGYLCPQKMFSEIISIW